MSLPSYREFIHPLLRYLAQHTDGARITDAFEAVADVVGVTAEERKQLLPSGAQEIYKNRIGWAHDRLKRAGLSTSPRRGIWQLTAVGRSFATEHPRTLPDSELYRLAKPKNLRRKHPDNTAQLDTVAIAESTATSPRERIESAVQEVEESVADELLELIARSSPTFFENLVLDLLHAMGYGASRTDVRRVGGSGDGGIDGIISLDRLGLEKVYVQAKRWQGAVGRETLQAFSGALAGQRAKKGVFITTSTFTRQALGYAEQVSDAMVVVDGERLAQLMIAHGVGVTHKPLRLPQVDSDYFEEA